VKLSDLGVTREEADAAYEVLRNHTGGQASTDLVAIVVLFGRSEKVKRAIKSLEKLARELRCNGDFAVQPDKLAGAIEEAISILK